MIPYHVLFPRVQPDRSTAEEKATSNVLAIYWALFTIFVVMTGVASMIAYTMTNVTMAKMQSYCSVAILATCATAYYAMATAEGHTRVDQGSNDNEVSPRSTRHILYTLTYPLTLLQLHALSAMDYYSTYFYTYCSIFIPICRLIGGLEPFNYRWGWYALSWCWFVPVVHQLVGPGRRSARQLGVSGVQYGEGFGRLVGVVLACLTAYGIIWGLAEGGNTIPMSAEMAAYGVTDLVFHV
ncbi:hypothetical protein HK097_011101 [Rhizophlyctis rosea]|uniref:Uncharacterized protein n=1 Tax=Rhizophlyctis rosea TaxID=64517 RepID=A0AAD5S6T7_9FUNG|nr:hypothetical protein HK097_011101 [Rhizophlyctis rosea]